jgi:hypothetical protein
MKKSEQGNQLPTYSIKLRRDWDTPKASYPRGVYRVPVEMPEAAARTALIKGIAVKVMPILQMKSVAK